MSTFQGSITPVAAVNWIDLFASGEFANDFAAEGGRFFVTSDVTSRVALGVTDPGTSGSAGIVLPAGIAVECLLGSEASNQTCWVQTLASADAEAISANTPTIHVDVQSDNLLVVIA